MPAIASIEDLRAAQKDLQEAKDLNELKAVFKKQIEAVLISNGVSGGT